MANPANGLVADNSRPDSHCSIAAVGFPLSCYAVGVERGFMPRAEAVERTLAVVVHESHVLPAGALPDRAPDRRGPELVWASPATLSVSRVARTGNARSGEARKQPRQGTKGIPAIGHGADSFQNEYET